MNRSTCKTISAPLCILLLLCVSANALAQSNVSLLITNVHLLDPDEPDKQVLVNLLIVDGILDIVTRDAIDANGNTLTVDAQEGFLIGRLETGQAPSFMVFAQDPRTDFDILLDTRTYARFAIDRGRIVKNLLPEPEDAGVQGRKRTGWLAYTPPPMALPSEYLDDRKWNKWESRYVSGIFLGALVLDRMNWFSQDDASNRQVGDLDDFDGGEIRGLRFGSVGTLNFATPWVYTVFGATNAFDKGFDIDTTEQWSWYDYRLDIPLPRALTLSVGKQKEPISMERLMGLIYLPMQERAAVLDAMLPARNFGVTLSGTAIDQRISWAGGLYNDWVDTSQSFDDSANQVIGRITGLPFVSADDSNLLHLGLGLRYTDARESARFGTEPEFNQSPLFVDTGVLDAQGAATTDVEVSWRRGPVWVSGEFLGTQLDAPDLGDPFFRGYNVTGSWIVTGEMRPYFKRSGVFGPVPVAKSVNRGGWGAWEAAMRWSSLDLTDSGVDGGDVEILSLGLNWWLTPFINVNGNVRHVELDRFGERGKSDGVMFRLMLSLD